MSLPFEYTPHALALAAVSPGQAFLPQVTIYGFQFFGDATATVVGGDGHFKVVHLVSYGIERAENGEPIGMEIIGESDGTEPVDVAKSGTLDVRVLVTAPTDIGAHFSAQLAVSGRSTPRGRIWAVQVPIDVVLKKPDFWLTGLEVIQSVQTPDNGVPLIGHKPTFVRAYVQSDVPLQVTGRLTTIDNSGTTRQVGPVVPSLTATPGGSQRAAWSQSLNFQLPDDLTSPGRRDVTVTLFDPVSGPDANPPPNHLGTLPLQFRPRVDLHVYGVVWSVLNDDDNQGTPLGPAAPWSDFEGHRQYVENVYPVSSFTIDPVPGIGMQAPNPQTFGNLLESRQWATEKLGQLPANSILNLLDNWDTGGLHGFAWGRACEEQDVRDIRIGHVMAQEVAHCLGLWWHTFSEGSPYPRPDGTIGSDEICLDLSGPQPALVSQTYDIMSYGGRGSPPPKHWASAFTYGKLLEVLAP